MPTPRKTRARLRGLNIDEVSPVDRAANKRRFLLLKEQGDGGEEGKRRQIVKEMPEDMSAARRRELSPRADMTDEELREQQAELGAAMEIEVLPGSPLRFPADFPADIRLYADPVNRRLPNDTEGRAQAAVGRARQTMDRYGSERSKRIVWERVIRALLRHGLSHRFDPDDPLDRSLPRDLQDVLQEDAGESTEAKKVRAHILDAAAAAADFAKSVAGHRASIIEARAAAERRQLEKELAKEREERAALERELARVKKSSRRQPPPAPSSMSHGEDAHAGMNEPFAWGHDLTHEACGLDRRQG